MGTLFHYDEFAPASDEGGRTAPGSKRQVELFTESGTRNLHLRIGELNEESQGTGYSVHLTEPLARALLDALERGMTYVGIKV